MWGFVLSKRLGVTEKKDKFASAEWWYGDKLIFFSTTKT